MEFNLKDATVEQFQWLWDNNGFYGPKPDERIEMKDALTTTSAPFLFPQVMSNIVKEAIEPLLIVTSLLQRINFKYGQTISFPAAGAIVAGDIGEGEEYPERSVQIGGSTVSATVGKCGCAFKVTEEVIRYSQYDVLGMHLRAAGRAMARWKETKAVNYILTIGVTAFDNLRPANSIYGVTTGRDLQGAANGSVTMDDIFDAFGQVITQGFMPNTLLIHPLAWVMFIKDPQMRAFVQANGGGQFFASWTGNPAGKAPWSNGAQGTFGPSGGQNIIPGQTSTGVTAPHGMAASNLLQYPQTLNSAPTLPNYMNVPFRIIVSPYVPYDARRRLTDIFMFDSNELGVLIVDEEIQIMEFADPARDIQKVKLRERYGIAIPNEGLGIAKLCNVHVVPNEIVLPAQAQIDVSGPVQKIPPSTPLSI